MTDNLTKEDFLSKNKDNPNLSNIIEIIRVLENIHFLNIKYVNQPKGFIESIRDNYFSESTEISGSQILLYKRDTTIKLKWNELSDIGRFIKRKEFTRDTLNRITKSIITKLEFKKHAIKISNFNKDDISYSYKQPTHIISNSRIISENFQNCENVYFYSNPYQKYSDNMVLILKDKPIDIFIYSLLDELINEENETFSIKNGIKIFVNADIQLLKLKLVDQLL